VTVRGEPRPRNNPLRPPWRRRTPRDLADALAVRGVAAQVSGRSVRAWLPGREGTAVWVVPGWHVEPGRGWLRRRVWSWRRGNSSGWRRRADTAGAAMRVATLLLGIDRQGDDGLSDDRDCGN
jgi:hypothetical protein